MKFAHQPEASFCLHDWFSLEVVRGALRDEHRRWEARRGEGEDVESDED